MAGSSNRFFTRRAGLLGLSLLTLVLVLAVGVLLWQTVALTSLTTVARTVDEVKPVAGGVRLLLIALLALAWPRFVAFAAQKLNSDECTKTQWLALRWRVTVWLLVIELVLGQNLLGRFLTTINGPAV